MIYAENQIQQVKNALDIVDVISKHLSLKVSGKYLKALCPFHQEKTPSFFVDPSRQLYRCYGCGKHGDAISFVMDYNHLPFTDALQRLAADAGISLKQIKQNPEEVARKEQLAAANKLTLDFYHYQLTSTDAGRPALEYLLSRDLTHKTINTYKLGYAPDTWDAFVKFIPSSGHPLSSFEELGLVSKTKKGDPIDRFRHRIIFPILNQNGVTAGFGARRLKEEEQPKYINSPETPVYKKKEILYGLFYAADSIRREGFSIFVEGYTDFLRLQQEGISNVVATSGTSLTEEQAKLIKRYANTVYMCYDSDDAGIRSTVKSARVLLPYGIDVKMIVLPSGEDPDSVLQHKGKETFLEYIGQAADFSDYLLRYYRSHDEYETPKGKTAAARHVLSLVARIPDPLKQDFYMQDLAVKMHIDPELLKDELKRQIELFNKEANRQNKYTLKQLEHEKKSDKLIESKKGVYFGDYEAEKEFIYLGLQLPPEEAKNMFYKVTLDHFQNRDTKAIVRMMYSDFEESGKIDVLTLEEKHFEFFSINQKKGLFVKETIADDSDRQEFIAGVILNLEEVVLIRKRDDMEKKFIKCSPASEAYREYSKALSDIHKQIQSLKLKK